MNAPTGRLSERLTLPQPYLLFLGDTTEASFAKTAFGLADWAADRCVGEFSAAGCTVTTGLPRLDPAAAKDIENYAVEQWNYLWTSEYGSPEVSAEDPTIKERDPMDVESASLSADGKTVFLKIPDLKPVMQQKIQMKLKGADGKDVSYSIFHTINKLGGAMGDAGTTAAAAGKKP